MASESFKQDLEKLIDQLFRHSDAYRYKSHNLQNLQDYLDYYHILADAMANEIISHEINHILKGKQYHRQNMSNAVVQRASESIQNAVLELPMAFRSPNYANVCKNMLNSANIC